MNTEHTTEVETRTPQRGDSVRTYHDGKFYDATIKAVFRKVVLVEYDKDVLLDGGSLVGLLGISTLAWTGEGWIEVDA